MLLRFWSSCKGEIVIDIMKIEMVKTMNKWAILAGGEQDLVPYIG